MADLTGKRFGAAVVIDIDYVDDNYHKFYKCRCDCGEEFVTRGDSLTSGKTTSCGCLSKERITKFGATSVKDLTGQQFGMLTVESRTENRGEKVAWHCRCDCGNTRDVPAASLLQGDCKSCGCEQANHRKKIFKNNADNLIDCTNVACLQSALDGAMYKNNTSGTRGVVWHSGKQKWIAQIGFKRKNYILAVSSDKTVCIAARKAAENYIYGNFLDWYYETYPEKKKDKESE